MEEKQIIELKGNELGWLVKLAETHFYSEPFINFLRDKPKLFEALRRLMLKFHSTRFYSGDSTKKWILKEHTD